MNQHWKFTVSDGEAIDRLNDAHFAQVSRIMPTICFSLIFYYFFTDFP